MDCNALCVMLCLCSRSGRCSADVCMYVVALSAVQGDQMRCVCLGAAVVLAHKSRSPKQTAKDGLPRDCFDDDVTEARVNCLRGTFSLQQVHNAMKV